MKIVQKMVHKTNAFVFIVIFSLVSHQFKAQNSSSIQWMEVHLKKAKDDTTNLKNVKSFKMNTKVCPVMVIKLSDTLNIYKVHVVLKLDSTKTNNIFVKSYVYNQQEQRLNDFFYSREKNILRMGMGNYLGLNTCFAEVKLEYVNGILSPPVYYKKP